MRPADAQAEKTSPENDSAAEFSKEQLEEMAVAFTGAIAKLDHKISADSKERSEYKKKLRAVEAKLVTINTKARMSGGR